MLKDQRETSSAPMDSCEVVVPAKTVSSPPESRGCSVAGCSGRFLARGYCVRHYYQVKRHGAVQAPGQRYARAPRPRTEGGDFPGVRPFPRPASLRREMSCGEDGCGEGLFAHGFCRLHYIRARSRDLLA